MHTAHTKLTSERPFSRWLFLSIFLLILAACSEPKKEVEASEAQHLIERLDAKIAAGKKAYELCLNEISTGTASDASLETYLLYMKEQRAKAEKTIVFEGLEYVENQTGYLKHVAIKLMLGYEGAIENEFQQLLDRGISIDSDEGKQMMYGVEPFILSMTQMYEAEKEKMIALYKLKMD